MRLIHVMTLQLEEFSSNVPPYAILSHTWTNEEVTFDEVQAKSGTGKSGWRKVLQACRQAHEDGHLYIWVDTCCINKNSSAELSESINSMFRWYQEAVICYTYLEDILKWEHLRESRWFTRGWTLQELLAPRVLHFYDSQWKAIGTREHLALEISAVTKIDIEALYGTESSEYIQNTSIAKRMAWAARRTTTRGEDIAYCLLGLFSVNIPLLYGEGGTRAFKRLQEEIVKQDLDQSFLAWERGEHSDLPCSNDLNFFADHPRCFKGCENILTTGEDVDPFSLNNQGLQMRVPILQVTKDPSHFIAILACHREGTHGMRIGINLKAVNRTGKHFVYLPRERHEVTENQLRSARLRHCCILRTSNPSKRRFLWIHSPQSSEHIWRQETVRLLQEVERGPDMFQWKLQTSGKDCIELLSPSATKVRQIQPEPISQRETTYGVIVTQSCPSTLSHFSKFLIRVDIRFSRHDTANISIHTFQDDHFGHCNDFSKIPNAPADRIPGSSSQSIVVRSGKPEIRMIASIAGRCISGQEGFVLNIIIDENLTMYDRLKRILSSLDPQTVSPDALALCTFFASIAALFIGYVPLKLCLVVGLTTGTNLGGSSTQSLVSVYSSEPRLRNLLLYISAFLIVSVEYNGPAMVHVLLVSQHMYGWDVMPRIPFLVGLTLLHLMLARSGAIVQWLFVVICTIGLKFLTSIWELYISQSAR